IPSKFNNIEKSAVHAPPNDLPHGGCNFCSGQIAPSDHTLPTAFPQQRKGAFRVVLPGRAERFKILPDHGDRWPSIQGFRSGIPILNDTVRVAHDHAFGCEIEQFHTWRRRERAFGPASHGFVDEASHRNVLSITVWGE